MISCPWPVERLLPHAAPMLLVDEAVAYSDTEVMAAATMRPDHPFARPEGVPGHVGIELMAQACGVHVGALALASAVPVRLGFLLGTRRYQATTAWFRFGQRLELTARVVFRDEEMAVYDCRINADGELLAEAQLNLYQPKDGIKGSDV
ncbi:MAG: 3-hydroxylacyl-ACP dehydratase [Solirubrobacterales bacterium]